MSDIVEKLSRLNWPLGNEAVAEIEKLRAIGRAILDADQRGQGQLFAEAMDALHDALSTGKSDG